MSVPQVDSLRLTTPAYQIDSTARARSMYAQTEPLPPMPSDSVSFSGKDDNKKKNNGAAWILTTLSAAALIFAGVKCHGKATNAEGVFGKIKEGAQTYWKEFTPKVTEFWNKCKFWENWGKK